jgi:hypothetical protein
MTHAPEPFYIGLSGCQRTKWQWTRNALCIIKYKYGHLAKGPEKEKLRKWRIVRTLYVGIYPILFILVTNCSPFVEGFCTTISLNHLEVVRHVSLGQGLLRFGSKGRIPSIERALALALALELALALALALALNARWDNHF